MPIEQPAQAVAPIVAAAVEVPAVNAAVAAVIAGQPAAVVGAAVAAVALPETGIAPVAPVVQTSEPTTPAAPVASADGTPADAPVVLTRAQALAAKIEAKQKQYVKLAEEIAKLEQQFRAVDLLDSVKQGSVIIAKVGRADTAKEVEASVIGVQTLENGDRRLKIYFGEGFEAETVIIQDSQIVDVKQA